MKQRIRDLPRAVPFQPFVIRMAGGREYRVEHPGFRGGSQRRSPGYS
jgi:hypothetical protein